MQRYFDVVQNRTGDAIANALVSVYIGGTTTLATLFLDNGVTPQANPVTTNLDGEYAFYAANGTYTLQITATNYVTETRPGVVLFDPSDANAVSSNNVSFLQAGTGAVTRTAQAKMRDVVSVADFGVVGDGVTDDTDAFQVAVNSGFPLYIPANFNCLFGNFAGVNCPSGFKLFGPGKITVASNVAGSFKAIDIGNAYVINNTDKSDILIDGVTFYSAADQQFSVFIFLENGGGDLTDVIVRNCKFIYAPATVTGGDRWAVSFGGEFGDLRARIYIDNNELYGPMQLTANGQNANYQDITISNNKVVGARNACIALSRLSATSDQNTYDRITIKGNHLFTDRGLGIFFGADSSSSSTAPMTWRDVDVSDNTITMSAAGDVTSQFGVFFRAPEGAASVVQRVSIRNNKIRVNASSAVGVGTTISREGTSTAPTTYEYTITENTIYGGGIDARGGVLVRVGNNIAPDERSFFRNGINAEVFENEFLGIVMDDFGTVRCERNRVIPRANGQRCFYVNSASGKTNTLFSVDDLVDYRGTSGAAESAYRLEGIGSVNATIVGLIERYTSWSQGVLYLLDGQTAGTFSRAATVLSGSFTPTIRGTSSAGTGTYSLQVGRYTKIGTRVFFNLTMVWTNSTGTGNTSIGGLPFTALSTSDTDVAISIGYIGNITATAGRYLTGLVGPNTTNIIIYETPTGGGTSSGLTLDTAGTIYLSGHYETAA